MEKMVSELVLKDLDMQRVDKRALEKENTEKSQVWIMYQKIG